MANALDYVDWRGDLSFDTVPVNEIDKYIFTCIGKPDYTGIIPADDKTVTVNEAVGSYFATHEDAGDKLGLIASASTLPMLRKIALSDRFRDIKLSGFINKIVVEKTEQFSALTVFSPDGVKYVSFRGTDDTIVGWKENCELAVKEVGPAQSDAKAYLEWAAETYDGPIIVCGHSKGGNLAVYAACTVSEEIQDRILEVNCYDGPGFMPAFLETEGYKRMKDKITTFVPYMSIVGMLLTQVGRLDVIQASDAGAAGHDGFTWDVFRDRFIHCPELSDASKIFNAAIDEAIADMDSDERRELVEEIFDVLTSTGAFTLSEFSEQSLRKSLELANQFRKAPELRSFLLSLAEKGIKSARNKKSL